MKIKNIKIYNNHNWVDLIVEKNDWLLYDGKILRNRPNEKRLTLRYILPKNTRHVYIVYED